MSTKPAVDATKNMAVKAFNTTEVRKVLEEKGLKLQAASLFEAKDDGTVRVDIEGDGIFDKFISGLIAKDGSINTKASKIDVQDEAITTALIKAKNAEVEKLQKDVNKYQEESTKVFDNKKANEDAEKAYQAELKKMQEQQEKIKKQVEVLKAKDVLQMTSDEFKAYQKDVAMYTKAYGTGSNKIASFEKNKNNYIASYVQNQKTKFDADVKTASEQLKQARKRFDKAVTDYNDLLEANGYKTAEDRKNVKEGKIEKKGQKVEAAKTQADNVTETVKNFVKNNKQLADQLGENYKIEIKGNEVLLKADDGDNRADFTITGLFNTKKGRFSVSAENIRYTGNVDSTLNVKAKIKEYKAEYEKLNKMLQDPTTDLDSDKYKEQEKLVKKLKKDMISLKVSQEEMNAQ